MALLYSTESEYALRAMIHLAEQKDDQPLTTAEIAEGAEVPRYFLAKILQRLSEGKLLVSTKGPGGGFQLAKAPNEIVALDVVNAIDTVDSLRNSCVLGLEECSDDAMCPLHRPWKRFREQFLVTLEGLTLVDLARELEKKRRWLKEKGKASFGQKTREA